MGQFCVATMGYVFGRSWLGTSTVFSHSVASERATAKLPITWDLVGVHSIGRDPARKRSERPPRLALPLLEPGPRRTAAALIATRGAETRFRHETSSGSP